jgi:hypothetical protein
LPLPRIIKGAALVELLLVKVYRVFQLIFHKLHAIVGTRVVVCAWVEVAYDEVTAMPQRCSLLHSVITKYVAALNQICSCFARDFPFLAGCAFWSFEQDQRIQYAPLLTLHRRADNLKYANNVSQRGCSTVPSGRGGLLSTDRLMLKVYNTYKQAA